MIIKEYHYSYLEENLVIFSMWTSNYLSIKTLKKHGILPISTAFEKPSWFIGIEAKKLMPPRKLQLSYREGNCTERWYKEEYLKHISKLDPVRIEEWAKAKCEKEGLKDIAFLGNSPKGKFCHRHLIAEWLNEYGYQVEEFTEAKLKGVIEMEFI